MSAVTHCELCAEELGDPTKCWVCGPPHNWLLCGVCREAFWSGHRWKEVPQPSISARSQK